MVQFSTNKMLSEIGDIGLLQQLTTFCVDGCAFEAPPVGLVALCRLYEIDFDNNVLAVAPSIRGMSTLRCMRFAGNALTTPPDGLEDATQIRLIDLSNNNLQSTVPNLSRLALLQQLYLEENDLTMPIEGIDKLSLLTRLNLDNNPCEQIVSQLSASSHRLSELSLSGVAHSLPIGLSDCVNLTLLDVYIFIFSKIFDFFNFFIRYIVE